MPYRAGSGPQAPPGYATAQRVGSSPARFTPVPVKRVPTESSYHSFNGTPWNDKDDESETWMRASDARHQQAGITAGYMRPYPSPFGNKENLQFSSPGSSVMKDGSTGWLHNPLIPGQKETWVKGSGRPGAVRSFYTKGQPADFDVAYHDKKAGVTGGGPGVFVMANYHAALPPPLQPLGPVPQGPRRGSYH